MRHTATPTPMKASTVTMPINAKRPSTKRRMAILSLGQIRCGQSYLWYARSVQDRARGCYIRRQHEEVEMDDKTRTELEAATFRALVAHLRERTDVQNIDLMNLAGFCRNCLSKWYRAAAEERNMEISDAQAREIIYGMPYERWKAKYQTEAMPEQRAALEKSHGKS